MQRLHTMQTTATTAKRAVMQRLVQSPSLSVTCRTGMCIFLLFALLLPLSVLAQQSVVTGTTVLGVKYSDGACPVTVLSLCSLFAIALQSLCNGFAMALQSPCHRFVIASHCSSVVAAVLLPIYAVQRLY
jgi:hypothetical protein